MKKLKIGPYTYKIAKLPCPDADSANELGYCNITYKVLAVKEGLDRYSYVATLMHEINHAIVHYMNILGSGPIDEERLVDCMANAWLEVFRDNPKLLDLIQDKLGR